MIDDKYHGILVSKEKMKTVENIQYQHIHQSKIHTSEVPRPTIVHSDGAPEGAAMEWPPMIVIGT